MNVFKRRDYILTLAAITGLVLSIGMGVHIAYLRQDQTVKDQLIESQQILLRQQAETAGKTAAYIQTICSEYRKLYQSYRELRYAGMPDVDKFAGLPGSASGKIDDCYKPE